MISRLIALASTIVLATQAVFAAECRMTAAFKQPDRDRPGGSAEVWKNADPSGQGALFFEGSLHVNTDGTKRSYSVEDFWGETKGLNNLCNAMSDACAGLDKEGLKARRVLTQQAYADGWPSAALRATRIASSIIPFRSGKPCPLLDGFLVSATSLFDPSKSDVCDISRYVDALTVPALVLPGRASRTTPTGFEKNGAAVGDLVVVLAPGRDAPVYAVVGDTGPAQGLGEGSIALNGKLNAIAREPKNYRDVKRNWDVDEALVVVFPGTRSATKPHLTVDQIDADARRVFVAWGGGDESAAVARLKACGAAYSSK